MHKVPSGYFVKKSEKYTHHPMKIRDRVKNFNFAPPWKQWL